MGNRKRKYSKKRKNKVSKIIKKIFIMSGMILSIIVLFNITSEIKYIKNAEENYILPEKKEFIDSIKEGAKQNYKIYGILPSITISQAILESGWGKSEFAQNSNNLFGIKADDNWDGEVIEVITSENYDLKVKAKFRKYESLDQSIEDHGKFLAENNRYKEFGFFDSRNYKQQAKALERAGYSTKENEKGEKIYAEMLIEIIEEYNLELLDNKILNKYYK